MKLRVVKTGYFRSGNMLCDRILTGLLEAYPPSTHSNQLLQMLAHHGEFAKRIKGGERVITDGGSVPNNTREIWGLPGTPIEREEFLAWPKVLFWTHDTPDEIEEWLDFVAKRIYVVRDGRAAINSQMHFVVLEATLKRHPQYQYTEASQAYADLWLFERYVTHWADHVRSYYRHVETYELCRFEDLAYETEAAVRRMSEALGDITTKTREIADAVAFTKLNEENPLHFRSGDNLEWVKYFTDAHKEAFKRIAGDLLIRLNYEDGSDW